MPKVLKEFKCETVDLLTSMYDLSLKSANTLKTGDWRQFLKRSPEENQKITPLPDICWRQICRNCNQRQNYQAKRWLDKHCINKRLLTRILHQSLLSKLKSLHKWILWIKSNLGKRKPRKEQTDNSAVRYCDQCHLTCS